MHRAGGATQGRLRDRVVARRALQQNRDEEHVAGMDQETCEGRRLEGIVQTNRRGKYVVAFEHALTLYVFVF